MVVCTAVSNLFVCDPCDGVPCCRGHPIVCLEIMVIVCMCCRWCTLSTYHSVVLYALPSLSLLPPDITTPLLPPHRPWNLMVWQEPHPHYHSHHHQHHHLLRRRNSCWCRLPQSSRFISTSNARKRRGATPSPSSTTGMPCATHVPRHFSPPPTNSHIGAAHAPPTPTICCCLGAVVVGARDEPPVGVPVCHHERTRPHSSV